MRKAFSLNPPPLLILFAVLFIAPAAIGFSQDHLAEGDWLQTQGLYDEAITSYLRHLYFEEDAGRASEAAIKIARCYLTLGEGGAAARYADLALEEAADETERRDRLFTKIELLLAAGDYAGAGRTLALLKEPSLTPAENARRRFLQGITALYLRRWKEAALQLDSYFTVSATYARDTEIKVLKLLSFAQALPSYNPEAARIFSYILPGSGQAYAGEFFQGLNSFLVTGGAGTLVFLAIASGDIPDAILISYFIFLRFYLGSPYHAQRLAMEKNESRARAVSRAIFELLTK